MKSLIATLLATAAGASFAAAPTAALNHDPATYRNVTQQAGADYKAAIAQCPSMAGTAKEVCMEEAKAARARAEADAVAQYNNTQKGRTKARTAVAEADYALAKARCAAASADKDSCISTAKSTYMVALADAKADRNIVTSTTTGVIASPVTTTDTRDAAKAAAVDKCEQVAGQPNTGCLIDNRKAANATTTGAIANRTETASANAARKTEAIGATVAQKTENAAATVANKTERVADTVAAKTANVADKTGDVVADSVITTKVKADIFKEPELKSMAIHVETEKGVVMLSGFVNSKADADKAVKLARSVNGVAEVKSSIKVK